MTTLKRFVLNPDLAALVNTRCVKNATILMLAAIRGNASICRSLLDAGAEFDASDNDGVSAISHAARCGHDHILRILLGSCEDEKTRSCCLNSAFILEARAGGVMSVRLLLEAGAIVNCRDTFSATPLIWAATTGDHDILCTLLEAGADISMLDQRGRNALGSAQNEFTRMMLTFAQQMKDRGFDYVAACKQYKRGFAELAMLPFWETNTFEGKALTTAFREYMWTKRQSERKGFLLLIFKGQDKIAHNPVVPADVTDDRAAALYSTIFHRRIGRMIKPAEAATPEKTKAVEPWGRRVTGFLGL